MSRSYRDEITKQIDAIESDLGEIIDNCKSGDYSLEEIVEKLIELENKVF